MGKHIPFISDEMIKDVERIFWHGPRRAKHHDLRLGQWLVNTIYTKYCKGEHNDDHVTRVLFNLENQELWDLLKGYND